MLEWRSVNLPAIDGAILTHQGGVVRQLSSPFRRRTLTGLSTPLHVVPGTGDQLIVVASPGVGAPATTVLVEELAASGVRRIVGVDIAASLGPELRSGMVALVDDACCGDGTSPHYAFGEQVAAADAGLAGRLAEALTTQGITFSRGRVWTTDAPFRETEAAVAAFREQGAGLVDMETAALYAASRALGIATALALVIADELFDGWRPPADPAQVQSQLRRLAAAAKACLLA
jgi:uridine phosphorylase